MIPGLDTDLRNSMARAYFIMLNGEVYKDRRSFVNGHPHVDRSFDPPRIVIPQHEISDSIMVSIRYNGTIFFTAPDKLVMSIRTKPIKFIKIKKIQVKNKGKKDA
jgi:hypothetical protein